MKGLVTGDQHVSLQAQGDGQYRRVVGQQTMALLQCERAIEQIGKQTGFKTEAQVDQCPDRGLPRAATQVATPDCHPR
jgi:hypothetical protein